TKIEGIVLDPQGDEIYRRRIATEQEKGCQAILERIAALAAELSGKARGFPTTLGIGTPGSVSKRTGLLRNSNTVCLNGRPFCRDLEALLGRRFAVENDANCFAMAEAMFGAGRGKRLVFGVIMGTGCGGGIVIDGHVHTGLQRIGGEWGHSCMDPNGPLCYCGQRGCVETFISGGGLERRFLAETGEKAGLRDIVARYRKSDLQATAFMESFFRSFGRAMANLINILDPDVIVLGGGVSNIEELTTRGVEETAKVVFSDSLETPIVRHALGDSAGVIGAALIGV
ncbi:MAG: ROK family protein, partial [Candidatus Omnitrophota bacterium]